MAKVKNKPAKKTKSSKAKAGKPKMFKSVKAAAQALKRRSRPVAPKKLDRDTPAQPDAVARRLSAGIIEHPKGLPVRAADTRWPRELKIGKRHRKDHGDLKGLAASIDARGALLQPIVISPANELIAGDRRLKAWPLSKFADQPIPVRVVTIDSIIAGEWDENAQRKDFTPTEAAALADEIEKQLKVLARARQKSGKKADPTLKGNASDQAARVAGLDRKTISKARQVAKAAKENPGRFGKLQRDMDKSGKVNGPFKRLQVMQQTDAMRKAPAPLPMRGPYNVLVIDYSWPGEKDAEQHDIDARGRAMRDYPEMAIDKGCELFRSKEFQVLLAPDCVVYFWTTNHHMDQAFVLLKAMGFETERLHSSEHSTIGTWIKNKMGRGQVLRGQTEHCIIATRGKPVINLTNQTTAWHGKGWETREDSRKPDAFFAMVEELTPAPRYAEIFSRGGRAKNWDCHGDQVGKFAQAIAAAELAEVATEAKPAKSKRKRRLTPLEQAIAATPPWPVDEQGNGWPSQNGHVVSMTIDHDNEANVGTCACGERWAFPRSDLHKKLDAAIDAHWREMYALEQDAGLANQPTADETEAVAAASPAVGSAAIPAAAGSPPSGELDALDIPAFLKRKDKKQPAIEQPANEGA